MESLKSSPPAGATQSHILLPSCSPPVGFSLILVAVLEPSCEFPYCYFFIHLKLTRAIVTKSTRALGPFLGNPLFRGNCK